MIQLIRVELRKLRTTPALLVTLAITVALSVTSVVTTILLAGQKGTPALGTVANVNKDLQVGAMTSTAMLVLGILVIAGEYRHRTILGAYLAEPRRGRVLAAKFVTVGAVGAVLGAVLFGVAVAVAVPMYSAKGVHHLPVHLAPMWLGAILATAVYGMLGVAVGALARNTVGAIIGGIVWVQAIEVGLLQNAVPSVAKWLPTGAGVAVTAAKDSAPHLLSPGLAAVVLVGWAVTIALVAARFSVRRELR
jgi:ABC-2 type transport system permease protein